MDSTLTHILVNLRNRTGEERRRQTLCDKRDNIFVGRCLPERRKPTCKVLSLSSIEKM